MGNIRVQREELARAGHRCLLCGAIAAAALLAGPARANAVSLEEIGTYTSPVYVTSDPADPDRILVVEQDGRIRLTTGGQTTTFLDLDSIVLSAGEPGGGNEHGLLSMAFAPDYPTSGRLYVLYTGLDEGAIHVDELTASGDAADPVTREAVLTIPNTDDPHHFGGQLQFGPDGYLYVSTGDAGACCFDPHGNARDLESMMGKILRIGPQPGGGYGVPADNPFAEGDDAQPEIWSSGLRNPWRFSFDRATGALVISDVGQFDWEEVNYEPPTAGGGRGDDFGWPCREGPLPGLGCAGAFTDPVFAYGHGETCAITGGYVVRDPDLDELAGRYVYADFCTGEIRSVGLAVPAASDDCSEGVSVEQPTSFGEDADGRVYVVSRAGSVYRLVEGIPASCEAPPARYLPPQSPAAPEDEGTGPLAALGGKERQSLKRTRQLSVNARVDRSATLEVDVAVLADGKELFLLPVRTEALAAGTAERIVWTLSRRRARSARRAIRDGRRVTVRYQGFVIELGSDRGSPTEFEARLVLE